MIITYVTQTFVNTWFYSSFVPKSTFPAITCSFLPKIPTLSFELCLLIAFFICPSVRTMVVLQFSSSLWLILGLLRIDGFYAFILFSLVTFKLFATRMATFFKPFWKTLHLRSYDCMQFLLNLFIPLRKHHHIVQFRYFLTCLTCFIYELVEIDTIAAAMPVRTVLDLLFFSFP